MKISTFLLGCALLILAAPAWAQTNSAQFAAHSQTVTTSPAQADQAQTRRHLELLNQSTTATIYCTLDGSNPVASATAGQITLPPLGGSAWASGLIPSNQIICIATASAPLTIME
jgi:hypothetical protein